MPTTKFFDGQNLKSLSLTNVDSWIDAGFGDWFSGPGTSRITAESSYSAVGWLRRCVDVRAAALAALPWSLYRGETLIVDSNDDAPDNMRWLETLPVMLAQTAAAMAITSTAYWFKVQNRGRAISELRWFAPDTMTPRWDKSAGLVGFERKLGSDTYDFAPEAIVYFRYPNPLHETEPGASPVQAALADIGVLHSYTAFAKAYFDRGAIKATLLTVDGNPVPAEKERLKTWWQRAFNGLGNAFNTEVVSAAVHPVVVGEGIAELSNVELSAEKREAISTALGVPHSIVMSNAANFATAEADRLNFYDMTILPEARIVEQALNRQLFDAMGYRLRFTPEAMSIYQENEEQRAAALLQYVNAGFPLSVAAQLLGITLPDGMEYSELDPEPQPITIDATPQPAQPDPQAIANNSMDAPADDAQDARKSKAWEVESGQFRKWVSRNNGRRERIDKFTAKHLTHDDKLAIVAEVTQAEDGAAEDSPFSVTLPELPKPGSITPEWLKAMTLQLDPNDDEAEQLARMAIERRTERQMRQSLEEWLDSVLSGLTEDEVQNIAYMLRNNQMNFRDVLQRALVDSADLGVSVAVNQLETVGFGFDYTLANAQAREWARRYTDDVLAQLNTTNDRIVGEAVARWIDNGEPLGSLVDDLRPYFGQTRAQRIAATEVTRAYAEANTIAYQETGVVDRVEWRTAADERVCPVCGPMSGQTAQLGQRFTGDMYPPAHPNCRCWVVPVIDEA